MNVSNHEEEEKLYCQRFILTLIKKIYEPANIINLEKGFNIRNTN